MVPKLFIHNEYNTVIVENVLKRQRQVLKQVKKENEQFHKSTIDPRTFVILDDCLYDNTWTKDKMIDYITRNTMICTFPDFQRDVYLITNILKEKRCKKRHASIPKLIR